MSLCIEDVEIEENVTFKMRTLLKHNRHGDPLDTLVLRPYNACKRLCVVRTVKTYLRCTEEVRKHSQLLISFARPHGPILRDTLSRWTLKVMQMAGVHVSKYKSHSTRGASSSAAKRLGVPVSLILRQASWKSAQSFAKYYDKELDRDTAEVASVLLNDALR